MTITLQQYVTYVMPLMVLVMGLGIAGISILFIRWDARRARRRGSRVVDDDSKAT
jgi:hypothetical protein